MFCECDLYAKWYRVDIIILMSTVANYYILSPNQQKKIG